jgi:hypothetical protein
MRDFRGGKRMILYCIILNGSFRSCLEDVAVELLLRKSKEISVRPEVHLVKVRDDYACEGWNNSREQTAKIC